MALADTLINVAQGLLTSFGQNVTFTRTSGVTYDPAAGTTSSTTSTYSGYVYVSNFENSEIDGTNIKINDLKVIASDMDETPQESDTFVISSKTYRIFKVNITNVSGTDVLYEMAARV